MEFLECRALLSAGSLDVVFSADGRASTNFRLGFDRLEALAAQPDGRVVAVGSAGLAGSVFAVARYNLDGTLDTSFGSGGRVTTALGPTANGTAKAVALQADGRVVVAGFAGPVGRQDFALARYLPDGRLDATFGTGGTVLADLGGDDLATSLAVTAEGKIVVAGSSDDADGVIDSLFALARFNADGTLDSSFGAGGTVTTRVGDFDAAVNSLIVQPDGKVVAAGHTSTSGTFFNFALARYLPSGGLDATFGQAGLVLTNFGSLDDPRDLALQPDGKVLAAGATNVGGRTVVALARYLPDGSLDATFGIAGRLTLDLGGLNQAAEAAALQPDGKLLVAGVYAPRGPSEFFVARIGPNGQLDPAFGSGGVVLTDFNPNDNDGAAAVALLPDGTLVVGGTSGIDFAVARYWGDNSPPDYALGSPASIFVNQTYRELLERDVDRTGMATWASAIALGWTRTQVVMAITASPEYRTGVIDGVYRALLSRPADPYGMQTFLGAFENGATVSQVRAAVLGSPEYVQLHSQTGFLTALYSDVLGRELDPTGAAAWGAALAAGTSREAVARAVIDSDESVAKTVQELYAEFLHRAADPSGLMHWTEVLGSGRIEAVVAGIVGSDEYFRSL